MFHPCSATLVVLSCLMSCVSSQSVLNCEIMNDQIKLGVNESCYIDLRSNRSTGYYWSVSSSDNSKLSFSEEYFTEGSCMGCPETLRITIKKKSKGHHKLLMILRPPARNAKPAETKMIDIR